MAFSGGVATRAHTGNAALKSPGESGWVPFQVKEGETQAAKLLDEVEDVNWGEVVSAFSSRLRGELTTAELGREGHECHTV